ncbi:hypothetical protein ACE1TI_13205 [Alteribacillus sp. JSM 102045]|uniref:hypothetical protein n=1 Tax=Alteribacillus sp. JSM 102045 TaxID=1562101 RepID=UPI0035BFDCD5
MEWFIIFLPIIGLLLFSLSLFVKEKNATKDEVEQMSLSMMGEVYHIKKRLQMLEEELLTVSPAYRPKTNKELANEAYDYLQQNMSVDEIAAAMQLKDDEVKYLLARLQ